jgi:hypothetical protein
MKKIFAAVILLSLGMLGCGSSSERSQPMSANSLASTDTQTVTDTGLEGKQAASAPITSTRSADSNDQVLKQNISLAQTSSAVIDTASSDRKVIRNAELDLEAEDPMEAQHQITTIAEIKGGFVVESQQSSSEGATGVRDRVTMTVRVPSQRFGEVLNDVRETSTRVVLETVKGQDVTEEFIDVAAPLRAKKALEQQFMEIMKRAGTIPDALGVQRQLADVRTEIERIEGRKRFLENQSSLSTIKIRLQTAKVFASTSSVGVGNRLAESFFAGADVALGFVLGLVTFVVAALPVALVFGLPAFLFIRYVLKRQNRPNSVADLADDEI